MALEQEISKGIMEAMKAKDTVRLTTLRNVKKYIIEAKTGMSLFEAIRTWILSPAEDHCEAGQAGGRVGCGICATEPSRSGCRRVGSSRRAADVPAQTDDR